MDRVILKAIITSLFLATIVMLTLGKMLNRLAEVECLVEAKIKRPQIKSSKETI